MEGGSVLRKNGAGINSNSVALVRERTIPTERPPPVGEVIANFTCLKYTFKRCSTSSVLTEAELLVWRVVVILDFIRPNRDSEDSNVGLP